MKRSEGWKVVEKKIGSFFSVRGTIGIKKFCAEIFHHAAARHGARVEKGMMRNIDVRALLPLVLFNGIFYDKKMSCILYCKNIY